MASESTGTNLDGIAVVGLAGRFPKARNAREYWANLLAGRECLTTYTEEELAAAGCHLGEHPEKRVRSRGVLENADLFDAAFFGYSPKEAEIMDPQQRVFLEAAWEALENAGYDPARVPGPVGVFAGAGINTYYPTNINSRPDVLGPFGIFPAVILNEKDFIATRVAYKLNLHGPALSVQTACSTSLVAICNACQSLLSFDCDIALAGGVALTFPQCHSHIHEEGGMISTDGHCKPFDQAATGTLFSDGVGVVALRRLDEAVAAGDTILAVIKGFALNNDGSDKAGFTAPSINGQARVIQMAQALGSIPPETITYIEAHGTATPLGDPIEIAGLNQAFRAGTDKVQFCAIGSVKSNIGHLDVAAGVAGLIKTVLALHHRKIPATLHYTGPNPKIDFASSPFYVADRLLDWNPPAGIPRRAGVSSFGIGGTNAHIVLEEAPPASAKAPARPWQLLLLSARSAAAVENATLALREHLASGDQPDLADTAYTLQVGRQNFAHRRAVVCRDLPAAISRLESEACKANPVLTPLRRNPPVVFMFPGQGAQRVNMGRELYETEPLYRDTVDRCAKILIPEIGLDLRDILFPSPEKAKWAEELIVQTRITQPALFVTEYALAQLWISWGIVPSAMIGHSVGEYVAACLAEVFSLEDGLRLIAARGRLIQEQPPGAMLAIMAPEADARPLLENDVSLAAINAPALCVASGPHAAIDALEKKLGGLKIASRRLQTSHAFHSAMMEPVLEPFYAVLKTVRLHAPKRPYVSNVTAGWISERETTDPLYWGQHLRHAVRFADGIATILAKNDQILLEVGPGATLTTLSRQHPGKKTSHVIQPSLPGGRDQLAEGASILTALGRLWQAGSEINWDTFHAAGKRRRVPLPNYPFERKRFFVEPGQPSPITSSVSAPAPSSLQASSTPSLNEGAASRESLPRLARIIDRVRGKMQQLSGLNPEELSATVTFLEMGFDSLFLSQVSRALELEFGIAITFRQLASELSSITRVAEHLDSVLPPEQAISREKGVVAAQSAPATTSKTSANAPALAELLRQREQLNRQIEALTDSAPAPREDITLPMTAAQREIWLACQLGQDISRTYNEAYLVKIAGALNIDALGFCLQELVDRHDSLRTTFAADGSGQNIAAKLKAEVTRLNLAAGGTEAEIEKRLSDHVRSTTTQVFETVAGPLFRFHLLGLGEGKHALLIVIHHLIADGWSWGVLLQELGEFYSAKAAGQSLPARPAMQYRDYTAVLDSPSHQKRVEAAEAYWLKALENKPEEIELPWDRSRPHRKTFQSHRVRHTFGPELQQRLKESARTLNCTVFHLLMAGFGTWLHRVTNRTDFVVGIPTAGQVAAGLQGLNHADRLVGHCVNMLPVPTHCEAGQTFRQLLAQVKNQLLDAREHQDVSFNTLVDKLAWPRDPSRVPLASVSLNFGRAHQVALAGLTTTTELPPKAYNFFDLTADVLESSDSLVVDCKFNQDLCEPATIQRWLAQWEQLLANAVASPDTTLGALSLLPKNEERLLLEEWNKTSRDFPREACLHHLVEKQVSQTPNRTAIIFGSTTLTYRELDERANRLAHLLIEHGIGPDKLVGICLDRSAEMVIALLAVLKSGGAYVPLDPAYPKDRIHYVLQDASSAVLLTSETLAANLDPAGAKVICVDRDHRLISRQPATPVPHRAGPANLAYVIYTSGSTGKPKGVQIEHRAAVNFMGSMQREPGLSAEDTLLAVTTLSFDIAGLEMFLPLVTGAKIVVAPRETIIDGFDLIKKLGEHKVTLMQATPATWRLLLAADWTGTRGLKILCGGEPLPADLAGQLLSRCDSIWNMYGPTETTIWSTCCKITDAADIHIGRPIDNTLIRIVDERFHPVPIGVPGELLIGGDGLARGYHNRPDLTAEKFIQIPGGRFYRTGDLARYRANGNIDCLGRLDFQVKVRGFRIELSEIEAVLLQSEHVANAVVVALKDANGENTLVAYCATRSATAPEVSVLRNHLASQLPVYMIPATFVFLKELPTTPNGKIDRKALPQPDRTQPVETRPQDAPRTATEHRIAAAFAEVLRLPNVSRDDNFFDLGGHSLLVLQMQARLKRNFGITLDLQQIFQTPTVAALAGIIDGPNSTTAAPEETGML